MDDFSRLGVNEVSTGNSTLISSSKYLNDPRLRDAMATVENAIVPPYADLQYSAALLLLPPKLA